MPTPSFSKGGRPESYTNSSLAPGAGEQTGFMSDFSAEMRPGVGPAATHCPSVDMCFDDGAMAPFPSGGEEDDLAAAGPSSFFHQDPPVNDRLGKRPELVVLTDFVKTEELLGANSNDLDPMTEPGNPYLSGLSSSSSVGHDTDPWNTPSPTAPYMKFEPDLASEYASSIADSPAYSHPTGPFCTPTSSGLSSPYIAPSRNLPCVPIFTGYFQPPSPALSQHSAPPNVSGDFFSHPDDLSSAALSSCPVTPGDFQPETPGPAEESPFTNVDFGSEAGSPLSSAFDHRDDRSDSGYCPSEAYDMGVNLASEATTPAGPSGGNNTTTTSGSNNNNRPDEPYAKLIYRALMSRDDKTMTLQEIYQWFKDNTKKTIGRGKGWQNSIRHNLSMNKGFSKNYPPAPGGEQHQQGVNPYASDNRGPEGVKRPTSWKLEPWAVENGIQSTTRYRKGVKRRNADAVEAFRAPRSATYHPYHHVGSQHQQRRTGPGPHRVAPRNSYRGGDSLRSMRGQSLMARPAEAPRSHMVAGPYYYQLAAPADPGSPGSMNAEPGTGSSSSTGWYPLPGEMTWSGYPSEDHHHHVPSGGAASRPGHRATHMGVNYGYEDWDVHSVGF